LLAADFELEVATTKVAEGYGRYQPDSHDD
jgi:hypothetical protein